MTDISDVMQEKNLSHPPSNQKQPTRRPARRKPNNIPLEETLAKESKTLSDLESQVTKQKKVIADIKTKIKDRNNEHICKELNIAAMTPEQINTLVSLVDKEALAKILTQ